MSGEGEVATRPASLTRARLLKRAAVGGAGLAAGGSLLAGEALAGGRHHGHGHGGSGGPGLRGHVTKIAQVVCNVSDLERAKAFWELHTPMRSYAKTEAPPQAFKGLGIRRGSFTGYLMRDRWDPGDSMGGGQFELHLVQWKDPAPVGKPYSSSRNVGWYRLAFRTASTQAKYDALVAAGVTPYAPPNPNPPPPLLPVTGFGFPDPDGVTIQILRGNPEHPDRLSHLACPVPDLQRQMRFFRDVSGLTMTTRLAQCAIPNPWDAEGGFGPYEAFFQRALGNTNLSLDIVQWGDPHPTRGKPYKDPTNLGYAQIVIEVDDITEAYASLRRQERKSRRPDFHIAAAPETWDLGPTVGTRRTMVLYDWLGIRYQVTEAPPFAAASEDPVSPATPCPAV